ncbi:MAG TPA: class E sortase [Jatrophihabitans sp.]|jgi:sortase A|uniref:class E sortase n=1 Tax=Jatrophihabitans sp. TaxID=1932789 RepID=UPI002DF80244|nr:class E sortase [Jatrophihabitans sp.]
MTDDTIVADAPPPGPPGRAPSTAGDKLRFVLRGIGQTLITLGLVVLLFVVYEVWITNIFSERANQQANTKLERTWATSDNPALQLPGSTSSTIPLGTGIANIYIPRLGADYHWTVLEGAGQDVLADGPGHYPNTAMPGQVGNFAVAGHRVGHGAPFLNLDLLRAGDSIIIETRTYWYVYRVKGLDHGLSVADDADHVPGREIVDPSAGRVLLPVPNQPGVTPTERLLTLTTCHPKFTAAQRMIIHALYQSRVPVLSVGGKRSATKPASIQALYAGVQA